MDLDSLIKEFNSAIEKDTQLAIWEQVSYELKKLREAETKMRKCCFEKYFKEYHENTNKQQLHNGYFLSANVPIRRVFKKDFSVDDLSDKLLECGVDPDDVIKTKIKYELVLSNYRKLFASEQEMINKFLTITEGTPTLKIGHKK